MLKNTLRSILLQKRTISTFLLMIVLLGSVSYATFPKEERPEVDLKRVAVIISYQGLSSDEIERLITDPLERELMSLEDIKDTISVSKDGVATFLLSFDLNTKIQSLVKLVRNKVEDTKSKLPEDIEIQEVKEYTSSLFSSINVGIYGNVPYKILNSTALAYKEQFEAIKNVLEVEITGGKEEIIRVVVIPELLDKYKVNLNEIVNALKSYNNLIPAGVLSDENADFSIKVPSLYESHEELKDLPIRSTDGFTLYLDDVSNISRTFEKSDEFVIVNGKPALSIKIYRKAGTNVLDSYVAVKKILSENAGQFHPLIETTIIDDDSEGIVNKISASENTVITAILLVMIIVISILGVRSGILIGLSIPLTYLLSILILDFIGMTYNIMTIFGLILAVGMLVDGPIVISEYARAEQERGVRRRDSYINASYNMFWPIIASALTTIVAFIPLVFWPDMIGQWLRVIPITVIVVLSSSLIVTLIFVPSLGAMIETKTENMPVKGVSRPNFLMAKYNLYLENAINQPIRVVVLTCLSFVIIGFLYSQLNNGILFFPKDKADSARINISARGNFDTEEKTKYLNEVLDTVKQNPDISTYLANTVQRKRIWVFDSSPTDLIGRAYVDFKDEKLISTDPENIISDIQNKLSKLIGYKAVIRGNTYNSSLNGGKAIELEVSSSDKYTLNKTAEMVKNKLSDIDGISNVQIKRPITGIEWKYDINREQTGKYDVAIRSIGSIISLATQGQTVGKIRPIDSKDELDIKLFLPENLRTLDQVQNIKINTNRGSLPISEFITKRAKDKTYSISRKNGSRNLVIDADVDEDFNIEEKISDLRQWKKEIILPSNVKVKFIGDAEDSKSSLSFVGMSFLLALLSMFIILICLFNNFYHVFIILFSLVLSTAGILIGLIILQDSFVIVMTGLGIVACAGIVVNNNIILIDSYRKIRLHETDIKKAIFLSTKSRLRPILMTTVTTVIGILPSALQISINLFSRTISYKSSETFFTEPLAWALVWGLSFAVIATLFVTPALLALPESLKEYFSNKNKSPILLN